MKTERYVVEYVPNTDKKIYRHKCKCMDTSTPRINLAIECDSTTQSLSLMLEHNNFFGDGVAYTLFWKPKGKEIFGELNYRKESSIGDYLFASELVKFIDLGFEILYNGVPLFTHQSAQAFLETFEDYNFLVCQNEVLK